MVELVEHEHVDHGLSARRLDHLRHARLVERLHDGLTLAQPKVGQAVITLLIVVPFAVFAMNPPLELDDLWAAMCLVGAVYFIFRA